MVKEKPKRKGFKRSKKEWEESIAGHIGNFVNRLSLDDLVALSIGIWGALHMGDPKGFATGLIGYKLAKSPSNLGAGAGLVLLGFTGLIGIPDVKPFLTTSPIRMERAIVDWINKQEVEE